MPTYKTKGIVIKKYPLNDNDQIIRIFTRDRGKLQAAVNKLDKNIFKFGLALDLFSESDLIISQRKGLDVIYNAEISYYNKNFRENYDLYQLASYYIEIISKIVSEGQANPEIYDLLNSSLSTLNNNSHLQKEKNKFQLQVLKTEGLLAEDKAQITSGEFNKILSAYVGEKIGKS